MSERKEASKWMILVAFAALYLIWGSTYLGIKIAIETMPPFFMAMTRFLLAGVILYVAARASGASEPSMQQWKHSLVVGSLLIAGGNGLVSFAEKWIDSSMAALVIASNPLFMVLLGWWGGVQKKPGAVVWLSLFGGFAGVAVLIASRGNLSTDQSIFGYGLVLLAVLSWTSGSVYSKRNPFLISPWLQSGMQMICGGLVCFALGLLLGEWGDVSISEISQRSWLAFIYLVVAGSLAGFTSYVFLLRHCDPSSVSSHAYVNPAVAVFLGWVVLGETLNSIGVFGAGLILVSVFALLRQSKI